MTTVVREIEGAWEDILARKAELRGKQVRLQVLKETPQDTVARLRALLKETQARANKVTEKDIESEVKTVRRERRCAS